MGKSRPLTSKVLRNFLLNLWPLFEDSFALLLCVSWLGRPKERASIIPTSISSDYKEWQRWQFWVFQDPPFPSPTTSSSFCPSPFLCMFAQLEGSQLSPNYYSFSVQWLNVRYSLDDLSTGGSDANGNGVEIGHLESANCIPTYTQNAVLVLHIETSNHQILYL